MLFDARVLLISKSTSHGSQGLVHVLSDGRLTTGLTWCGKRLRGVSWRRQGPLENSSCTACQDAIRADRPKRWVRR